MCLSRKLAIICALASPASIIAAILAALAPSILIDSSREEEIRTFCGVSSVCLIASARLKNCKPAIPVRITPDESNTQAKAKKTAFITLLTLTFTQLLQLFSLKTVSVC